MLGTLYMLFLVSTTTRQVRYYPLILYFLLLLFYKWDNKLKEIKWFALNHMASKYQGLDLNQKKMFKPEERYYTHLVPEVNSFGK